MVINLEKIYAMQEKLNNYIFQNTKRNYKNVYHELILALTVELAELANEVKSFKYWSNKKPSEEALILDEYVDGIHFILSLLIYYQITPIFNIKSIKKNDDKTALTLCFLELFKMVNQLAKTNGNKTMFLKKFCIKYLELGNMLGFNIEKITNGYLKKNQINYERQKSNY